MKVMVVDDDGISRMVLQHLLSSLGLFDICEAEDGDIAWDMLQAGVRPALCFCDGRMPRMPGLELLEKIQREPGLRAMPFVLVSATEEQEVVEQALQMGAAGYIVKPFDKDDVRAQLDKLLPATWQHIAEMPQASQKRLHINAQQLAGYLNAFEHQLQQAEKELLHMLAANDQAGWRDKLHKLHYASQTLGLEYAANVLEELQTGLPHADAVRNCLQLARAAVKHQLGAVQAG